MGEQNNKETTLDDVLSSVSDLAEAVNVFASKTEERFDKIEGRLDRVETKLGKVEVDITSIKSQMVTKDYLDKKMADQRGELVTLLRKEDIKIKTVVEILTDKKVFSQDDKNKVMALEPFAQLAL